MNNAALLLVTIFVNTTHIMFYIRRTTRDPLRHLLIYLLLPLAWIPTMWLARLFPPAMPVFVIIYGVLGMSLFRLICRDGFTRLFVMLGYTMAATQVMRSPAVLVMIYGFGWTAAESARVAIFTFPATFLVLTPFLLRYVRAPFMRILDVAERQKWYLVGLPPIVLGLTGGLANFMVLDAPHMRGMFAFGILMPLCVITYFLSIYLFLVSHSDREVLRQRLDAARQLEHTYEFYDRELAEKEKRVRALRHDFRHMALHLESLAREGDWEGMRKSVREVLNAGDDVAVRPFCENRTVNAIVSYHFAKAEAGGVNCTAQAFVPAELPLPAADLALIMGNALENCVKAAGHLGEMGYIVFKAKPARSYLMLSFENNRQPGHYPSGEGAGLASIRDVVLRHNGRVEVEEDDNQFRLTVFLALF